MYSLCRRALCAGIIASFKRGSSAQKGDCHRCTHLPSPREETVTVVHISHHPERRLSPLYTLFSHPREEAVTAVHTFLSNPGRRLSPLYTPFPSQGGRLSPLYTPLPTHHGRDITVVHTSPYPPWEREAHCCTYLPTHHGREGHTVVHILPTHHGRKERTLRRGASQPWEKGENSAQRCLPPKVRNRLKPPC